MHQRITSIFTALLIAGCQAEDPAFVSRTDTSTELGRVLAAAESIRFGAADGPAAIGQVMAARLTPDGTRVVILDRDPPFLKVFRSDGSFVGGHVDRGGGPRELEAALGLAVDDSRAFLVGLGTLVVVQLTGKRQSKFTPDFHLIDVGIDCHGRVVAYGPRGSSQPQYLHTLDVDSLLAVVGSTLTAEQPARMSLGFGRPSVIAARGGSVVSHRRNQSITPIYYSCDGGAVDRTWSWALTKFPTARPSAEVAAQENETSSVLTLDISSPINTGAAELPSGKLLWLESKLELPPAGQGSADDAEFRMEWFLADSTGMWREHLDGHYMLQDVANGIVVLSATEPWPHIILVRAERLEQALVTGKMVRRDK